MSQLTRFCLFVGLSRDRLRLRLRARHQQDVNSAADVDQGPLTRWQRSALQGAHQRLSRKASKVDSLLAEGRRSRGREGRVTVAGFSGKHEK